MGPPEWKLHNRVDEQAKDKKDNRCLGTTHYYVNLQTAAAAPEG